MKIALLGSAPSSSRKAPFGDKSWQIWGCSPGLYPGIPRVDGWFELHRWEPPVIGKPDQQVPWFSPEYCVWMSTLQCPVWMQGVVTQIPMSKRLPHEELVKKYGNFFFTSSLAWMAAMAIEAILLNRELLAAGDERAEPADPAGDWIGFWGVDMAADEEIYSGQKSGCQYFATLASCLKIQVYTPPESDLMLPRPLYGISEGTQRMIKLTARNQELAAKKQASEAQLRAAQANLDYINGALDDMKYHLGTWAHEGEISGPDYDKIFPEASRVAQALQQKPEGAPS